MPDSDAHKLRDQLVTCTRLMVMQEIMDFSGHVSARLPGTDRVLIQPRDTSRAGLTSDDMLIVDLDGNVLEGVGPAPSETMLHTCLYRARPDAAAICHGHPTYSTLFTMTDRPWDLVRNFAYRFADLPVHADTTHIRSKEQGDALAETLGGHRVCMLRGHGTAIVAPSVEELFMDSLDLEENARCLLYTHSLGGVKGLTSDEIVQLKASYGRSDYRAGKVWEHYLHKGRLAGVL